MHKREKTKSITAMLSENDPVIIEFDYHSNVIYFFVMGNDTLIDHSRGVFDSCLAVVMTS